MSSSSSRTEPEARFRAGEQSVIEVLVDEVDPVAENYAVFLASALSSAVNREIIERAATEGQGYAIARGESIRAKPSRQISWPRPTRAEVINAPPSTPRVIAFFGPAVLALILQHLAVTLVAMSLVRERLQWAHRAVPDRAREHDRGHRRQGPRLRPHRSSDRRRHPRAARPRVSGSRILADPLAVVATIGLLLLASLGVGLLIAVVSDSERQAVQLSLLVLLASVFFSGFVLAIEEFSQPVRALAFALPVTHGIRLLQDLMLRGSTDQAWEFAALASIAAVTLIVAWFLLRRSMVRA